MRSLVAVATRARTPFSAVKRKLFACVFAIALSGVAAARDAAQQTPALTLMSVTTKSEEARTLLRDGLRKWQILYTEEGLREWRKAVELDPQFALAHTFLFFLSRDPVEQSSEREKALATKRFAGHEEQLIIDWLSSSMDGSWIPAIQAMNEAQQEFPGDRDLAWLAGRWLTGQQQWGRAAVTYERVVRLDPNFPEGWNSLGYCYARTRMFGKAFAAMKKYTGLLPNESNSQDSFAEISRIAGKFDDALVHYRASLKIDPNFVESILGMADTLALMGDEAQARAEYAQAIQHAHSYVEVALFTRQSAITYVRENNYKQADAELSALAQQAHEKNLGTVEAEAYRMMALYQKDDAKALELLQKSESALHEDHPMPRSLVDQQLAAILRTRVERAVQANKPDLANSALKELAGLAGSSSDAAIQMAYDAASGAILLAQGSYEEAVSHLEEDDRNPFSLKRLATAYDKLGEKEKAKQAEERLAGFFEPTLEQALVVPSKRSPARSSKTRS